MPYSQSIKRILYVEDDDGLARLLQKRMQRNSIETDILHSAEEAMQVLPNKQYDVILLDHHLPGMSGVEFLLKLAPTDNDTPIIILTALGNEHMAVKALEAGAADYVVKDTSQTYFDLLPSVMTSAYTRYRLARELKEQQRLLVEYATRMKESEQRLNLAVEGSDIGIWDWDIEKNTLFWSTSLKKTYGLADDEEPDYEAWFESIHPDDRQAVQEAIADCLEQKKPMYQVKFRCRTAVSTGPDDWQWTDGRGIALFDDTGKPYRMLGSRMDITLQKQLEAQLELEKARAEAANQAKSEFLATISHEIRTPMNVVVGLAGLLEKTTLAPKQREMIETLRTNADVLLTIINDLLDISRIESGQVELESVPFNLSALLRDMDSMFAQQVSAKQIKFIIQDESPEKIFVGDRTRIHQILMNLCGNAIKFTESGEIRIISRKNGNRVELVVQDTGIGISPDKLRNIFDKFVQADQTITRRFGGSGLGLSICSTLAEMMGGTITVKSTPGEGSAFTVSLALTEAATMDDRDSSIYSPQEDAVEAIGNGNGPQPKVLLVEDYPANVMVATMLLEEMGYPYDVVNSGSDALEALVKAPTSYQAILMDVQMPDMDGFEATRRIRIIEKELGVKPHHIIGVTAHALAGDRDRCIKAGMNDYMTKPIQPHELKEKLSYAILTQPLARTA